MTMAGAAHQLLYAATVAVYVLLLLLVALSRRGGTVRTLLAVGCGVNAVWAGAVFAGLDGPVASAIDLARSISWCTFLIYLMQRQFADRMRSAGLVWCLAAIACFAVAAMAINAGSQLHPRLELVGYVMIAVYGAFLADNLYRITPPDWRWHVNLFCLGVGCLFVYDLVFYADALLFGRLSPTLGSGRALAALIAAPLLALSAARNRDWVIDIHVSRDAVYHTGSLIVSGAFLLALAMVGEAFRVIGPGWGELGETGLITAGFIAVGVMLTSGSIKSRLRHLLVDNFFTHRYDYRKEWLRCIETLSGETDSRAPGRRIIKAVAAVTDSPGGQLWLRDPEGAAFHWVGSWNLPAAIGAEPLDSPFAEHFRGGDWVVELPREAARPACLAELSDPWLAVPLSHLGRLLGFVVLTAPRAPFRLDGEVFDLLRILGRQAGAHAAEWQHFKAILEGRSLREFGKNFAFAVHDMKNVAGQLSMIVQNAERAGGDPEFHRDVMATVAAALDRTNALIERLRSQPRQTTSALASPLDLVEQELAAIRRTRGAEIDLRHDGGRAVVAADGALLRGVVAHLCDNAIEASDGRAAVSVRHEPSRVLIDIADCGGGMTAEFVRDHLFAPFGTTKGGGLGIGAYQARDLIRSMGGDLLVHSRPGLGTTMRIMLPCAGSEAATELSRMNKGVLDGQSQTAGCRG